MEEFIKKLISKVKSFNATFTQGYDVYGDKAVGIRSIENIIIDDTLITIGGDVYDNNFKIVKDSKIISKSENINTFNVAIRATALIYGTLVNIDLGNYKITEKENIDDYSGIIKLLRV